MTDKHDKLVEAAQAAGFCYVGGTLFAHDIDLTPKLAAFASAHVASLCADVKPIRAQCPECDGSGKKARWGKNELGRSGWQSVPCTKCNGVGALHTYPASTVASLTAQRDKALARVVELEEEHQKLKDNAHIPKEVMVSDLARDEYNRIGHTEYMKKYRKEQ